MEELLDYHDLKPLVGIIPNCKDEKLLKNERDIMFWERVRTWIEKDWCIALHGYTHVNDSNNGGLNPVNFKSEFAGHSYDIQSGRTWGLAPVTVSNSTCPPDRGLVASLLHVLFVQTPRITE